MPTSRQSGGYSKNQSFSCRLLRWNFWRKKAQWMCLWKCRKALAKNSLCACLWVFHLFCEHITYPFISPKCALQERERIVKSREHSECRSLANGLQVLAPSASKRKSEWLQECRERVTGSGEFYSGDLGRIKTRWTTFCMERETFQTHLFFMYFLREAEQKELHNWNLRYLGGQDNTQGSGIRILLVPDLRQLWVAFDELYQEICCGNSLTWLEYSAVFRDNHDSMEQSSPLCQAITASSTEGFVRTRKNVQKSSTVQRCNTTLWVVPQARRTAPSEKFLAPEVLLLLLGLVVLMIFLL